MSNEFNLLSALPRTTLCENDDVNECIRYLGNLAFSDVLDTCANTKFPGPLVVSLARSQLPLLQGQPASHLAYKPTDLLAWWQPSERPIPPTLKLKISRAPLAKRHVDNQTVRHETNQLDFGFLDGFFSFWSPAGYQTESLDFGDESGFFAIGV